MKRRALWQWGVACGLPVVGRAANTAPAVAALALADKAMGNLNLHALQFSGNGKGAAIGQSFEPGQAWPRLNLHAYALLTDYAHAALREEFVASRIDATGGSLGGDPAGPGEQRSTHFLCDDQAWSMLGPVPLPAPWAVGERRHALWTTPQGVLQAARRNTDSLQLSGGRSFTFSEPGIFNASVQCNAAWQVMEVQTLLDHPFAGDTPVRTRFADYKLWGGLPFPARIQQDWGGFMALDLVVQQVTVNPGFVITVPAPVQGQQEQVRSEALAEGVWLLHGNAQHSVAVEMKDHVLLVDAPLSPARAEALAAAIKQQLPDKPIAVLIHSHHHFDSSGGLRTAAAWGASILTAESNRAYVERLLTSPHRIQPDALARASSVRPKCLGVNGKSVLSDGTRSVEVHVLQGSPHAKGLLVVYLPAEKLLVEVDAYTPGPAFAPPPAKPQESHRNLLANIERLKLDVERIVPLRGRVVALAELQRAVSGAS